MPARNDWDTVLTAAPRNNWDAVLKPEPTAAAAPIVQPSLRTEAGPKATAEQALESGAVEKFLDQLRAKSETLEPDSEERKELAKRIAGLQGDLGEFNEQKRQAKELGVDRQTAHRLNQPVGAFEKAISQAAVGQTAMRAEQGFSNIAETGLSLVSRSFGDGRMSAAIHKDKQQRDEFLTAAEKGGDIQNWLGESGSRIYNGIVTSLAKNAALGTLAGPTAVYSLIAGESYDDGLEEARVNGITGTNAQLYAGTKAGIETGLSILFGKAGKKLGIETLEESFSPGMKRAAAQLASKAVGKQMPKLVKELAGVGMEGGEELAIDAVQQGVELFAGTSKWFNWGRLLEATVSGAGARGGAGVGKNLSAALRKIPQQNIEETVKGVAVAERALAAVDAKKAEPAVAPEAAAAATLASPEDQAAFEKIAAHQVQVEGQAGARGLNNALSFIKSATPQLLEQAAQPLNQKQFAQLTGIKKTSELFRAAFRDTLGVYANATKPRSTSPDAAAAASEGAPPSEQASTTPGPRVTASPVVEPVGKSRSKITVTTESGVQEFTVKNSEVQGVLDGLEARRPTTTSVDPNAPPVTPKVTQPAPVTAEPGKVKTWLKDNFTSQGLRNDVIDAANDAMIGEVSADILKADQLRSDLDAAVKAEFGGRNKQSGFFGGLISNTDTRDPNSEGRNGLTPEQVRKLDDALKGKPTDLPQSILAVINPMRAHVDALSRKMLESGVVDPESELGLTIDENLNSYLTRTYRKHDQKTWPQMAKANADLMDRTRSWLKGQFPDDSADVTEWRINALLDKNSAAAKAPKGVAKAERDFMGVLKERKLDNEPILRELYGEYRDPWINYTKSVAKMANLMAHKQFIATVKSAGLETGFLSQEGGAIPQNYRQIDATNTPRLAELNGLYTDPNTAKALQDLFSADVHGTVYRYAMKAAGFSKAAQTVGNSKTYPRNFVGNVQTAMANGDMFSGQWIKAGKATWDHVFNSGGTEAQRQYLQSLVKQRIIDSNVDVGFLNDMMGEMADLDGAPSKGPIDKLKGGWKKAAQVYQALDTIWKINGYENKKQQYAKAYPDKSFAEVEALAAADIRDHYPTYSKINKAVKFVGKAPYYGPFISFPAEVIRNRKNTLATISRELRSENPEVREMGKQRVVGLVSSFTLVPAISLISKAIMDITPQEEEDLRLFQAPWAQNAQFLYLNKDGKGHYDTVDLSFMDANNVITKPVLAFLRDGTAAERFELAATELVNPLGEDLLFGRAVSVLRNKTADGRQIWNDAAPDSEKIKAGSQYIGEALLPGTIAQLDRIKKGAAGEISKGGRPYDPILETVALVGARNTPVDTAQAFGFRNGDFARALSDAERGILSEASSRGTVTPGQLAKTYAMFNNQRAKIVADWHKSAMAAIRLGVPEQEVRRQIVEVAGREDAAAIFSGVAQPYRASEEAMRTIATRPDGRARVQQMVQMFRQSMEDQQAQRQQ